MAGEGPVRCQKCLKSLQNEALIVDDQFFHPACLKCAECSKGFAEKQPLFKVDKEPKIICKPCFTKKYSPICTSCKKAVEGESMVLLEKNYHSQCMPKCVRCKNVPADKQYSPNGDKLYCVECAWLNKREEIRTQLQKEKEKAKTSPTAAVQSK